MGCLSLAFWYDVAVYIIVLVVVCALLRLLIMALGGTQAPLWPPTLSPPAGSPSGFVGFLAAAINIIIWAVITLFILWLIFVLLSCLLGGASWPRFPR
jgi:hypothetical protein